MKRILAVISLLLLSTGAHADSLGSAVGGQAANQSNLGGGICQSAPVGLSNGQQAGFLIDCATHALITEGGGSGGSITIKPGPLTLVPLDVSSVTTGGTAVTALIAGHATAGGFLTNPKAATIDLCINQIATASGTTSAASLTCIAPGQAFNLVPSAGTVSVVTSDSAHPFSGEGYQ